MAEAESSFVAEAILYWNEPPKYDEMNGLNTVVVVPDSLQSLKGRKAPRDVENN